ncbi:MAG TPA: hypothetical protein PLF37_05055 [Planctomycetota bacterium]|nr:hypothetical protein [Planctomycetota bacterium]
MNLKFSYALLQAWYMILEGGLLLLLLGLFFMGKGNRVSDVVLIALILAQLAGLVAAGLGLSLRRGWAPLAVVAHCLAMCLLSLGTLPWRERVTVFDVAIPLLLHGGVAALGWRVWREVRDAKGRPMS